MQQESHVSRLMDLKELAALWRVSPHTIRSWVKANRLTPTRICRRLLFHPDDCARFLASHIKEGQIESENEIHGGSDFADRIGRIEGKDELVASDARQEAEARRKQLVMELMHDDV